MAKSERVAHFIEPMECLSVEKFPEGGLWTYELKLDGYRLIAAKTAGKVILYSRRGTDLTRRFGYIAEALATLPDETVIDGDLSHRNPHSKVVSREKQKHPFRQDRSGNLVAGALRKSKNEDR